MRGLLVVLLVGCLGSQRGDDALGGESDPPVRVGARCRLDQQCLASELCARTGSCWPASLIRAVHVDWTVGGAAASAETCSPAPDFEIEFRSSDFESRLSYAPVPCTVGRYTIDKLPLRFTIVRLRHRGTWERAEIDDAGDAVFDLAL